MKILSAEQIQKVDRYTIEHEPIPSIDLMERAASAFVDIFFEQVSPKKKVCIVCGRGNNGGDGLAIARMLLNRHYEIAVFVIQKDKKASGDFKANEKRLNEIIEIGDIQDKNEIPDFSIYDVLIDGLFGSGLSRPVEGLYAAVMHRMNDSGCSVFAIDIASGLFADRVSKEGSKVRADFTISFQLPKLAFLLPGNYPFVGHWVTADIGLSQSFIDQQDTKHFYIDKSFVESLLRKRGKYDHKGTWGRAVIMSGSYGKMGAAVLAGKAAMRSGLGLLTMHIPSCGYTIIQSVLPEAMVSIDEGDHFLTMVPEFENIDAIGIGPGIGKAQETVLSLTETIREFGKPMVFDADALNIIAEHREILEMLPEGSIITPHPKEFERLVGDWSDDFERMAKQRSLAKAHNLIVLVKGAHTSIALPDGHMYFNSTGNPGMATGGSGDVLTGIITALLAQGYAPASAATIGAFVHGLSGDIAAEKCGMTAMMASDIVDALPQAFQNLE